MKIDGIEVVPSTARVFRAIGGGFAVKVLAAGPGETLPGSDPELVFGPWPRREQAKDVRDWVLDEENEQEAIEGWELTPELIAA